MMKGMGTLVGAVVALLLLAGNALAAAPAVFGPSYPLGGWDAANTHGGSVCYETGSVYAGGTLSWTIGSDPATTSTAKDSSQSCDQASAPTQGFDLTRFQNLYWGLDPANSGFGYCSYAGTGQQSCSQAMSGPLTYDSADSNPATGVLVYQGTTTSTDKLTVHLPGAATDATTIGTFANQAESGSQIGQVWQVAAGGPFTVTLTYSMNGAQLPTGTNCECNTTVNISAGFYYVDLAPSATITPTATPENHVADTFQATDYTDPYSAEDGGATPTYAWDLSGGTAYADGTGSSVEGTFGPGTHTVALLVTDADGVSTRETYTFTIANVPPVAAFSCAPAGPFPKQNVTCTSTSSDPDAAPGDTLNQAWTLGTTHHTGNAFSFNESKAGTYKVSLAVTDRDGNTTSVSHNVVVNKPKATVVIASGQRLATVLSKGIKATFRANEAFTSLLSLTVASAKSKTGKTIKVTGAVATAKPALSKAGSVAFVLKLSATARRKLAEAKTVTFTLAGPAKDKFGNAVPIRDNFTLS